MQKSCSQLGLIIFNAVCLVSCVVRLACGNEAGNIELDERQMAAVRSFVDATKKVREQDYGNVHFVTIQTHEVHTSKKSSRTVEELNYWSRDNQYFRIDKKTIESSDFVKRGAHSRIVVAPDGYIALASNSASTPLTIRSWGSFEEGWDALAGNFCVQAAARSSGIGRADIMFGRLVIDELSHQTLKDIARQRTIRGITLSDDGFTLELKSTWASKPFHSETLLRCDVQKGVVLHYESKNFKNGDFTHLYVADKQYDFERFGSIPARQHEERRYEWDGGVVSYDYKTQRVSWEPVPLGVFSLEAQGLRSVAPGSVWSRRLLTLLVGLVLVGIFVAVKRARNRAAE